MTGKQAVYFSSTFPLLCRLPRPSSIGLSPGNGREFSKSVRFRQILSSGIPEYPCCRRKRAPAASLGWGRRLADLARPMRAGGPKQGCTHGEAVDIEDRRSGCRGNIDRPQSSVDEKRAGSYIEG